jgi:hypothetical protein
VLGALLWGLLRSPWGKAFTALRDNPIRAESLGVNIQAYTLLSFAIGAAYAGAAGALFASLVQFIEPAPFTVGASIMMYLMVVVGGPGYFFGPLIGSAVGVLLPEWLRFAQGWYLFVFGSAVVLLMLWLPDGLLSIPDRIKAKRVAREASAARARRSSVGGATMSAPLLKVTDLKKSYGAIVAVAGVSFEVMPGEIFGVIGPNGSGKTTMFNSVLGQIKPNAGKIELNGQDITGLSPLQLSRRGVGRTFQTLQVFGKMTRARQPAGGRAGAPRQHGQPHVRAERFGPGREGRRADRAVPHRPRGAQEGRRAELRPAEAGRHRDGLHERARPGAARRALRRREPEPGGWHQHAAEGPEPRPWCRQRAPRAASSSSSTTWTS